jgi:hypothetical protein
MAADSRPFHAIICPVFLRQQIRFYSVAHTIANFNCTFEIFAEFSGFRSQAIRLFSRILPLRTTGDVNSFPTAMSTRFQIQFLGRFAMLSWLVLPPYSRAGEIIPQRVIGNGDTTITSDVVQTLAAEAASINNSGNLAVHANVTGPNGSGETVIAVNIATDGVITRSKATFANPSSTRTYLSPWRMDTGQTGTRDRVTGSTPASLVRRWDAGTFTTLASTLTGGYSSVTTPSFSRNGNFFCFVGTVDSNALYLQGSGSAHNPVASLTGGGFRPMMANDGRTVLRTSNNTQISVFSPGGGSSVVSPAGLANPGSMPGISDDGNGIAFLGDIGGVPGIHAVIDGTFTTLAKPVVPSAVPDPFQLWKDSNNNKTIEVSEISGGLASFQSGFSRVAIKELDRPLGSQVLVAFVATGADGKTGVYYARMDRATRRVFGHARIAETGKALGGFTPTSFNLFDPLNIHGQIVFQASGGTGSAVFRHRATPFTKYKQGREKFYDVIAIGADPATAWFNQPVNPSLPINKRKTMGSVGCALTSAAIIAGIFGKETTPLEMRDLFLGLSPSGIDGDNNTYFSRLELRVGNKTLRKNPVDGGNFDSIATELRAGRPLMLCVPNKGSTGVAVGNTAPAGQPPVMGDLELPSGRLRANDKRHYILAYGLNPVLGPADPVTPADIYIADPAYTQAYKEKYPGAYAAGEEMVDVTLQDYFDIISTSGTFDFDTRDWFNNSTFVRTSDNRVVQVRSDDRSRQIQRFQIIEGTAPANPVVLVESPVEVRLTIGGVTYASSPSVLQPGDILAIRRGPDVVGEFDEENGTGVGADEPVDLFPPYLLELPPAAAGRSAQVEIYGVADGSYTVSLGTGISGTVATNTLQGNITTGAIVSGTIGVGSEVGGAPPPSLTIERLNATQFVLRIASVPGVSYQLQSSPDLNTWGPHGAPQVATGPMVEWTVTRGASGKEFFRASFIGR